MIHHLSSTIILLVVALNIHADELTVLPAAIDSVTPPDMMHVYLMKRVHQALDRRDAAYEKIETAEQLAAYQERMKQFFIEQIGGFPDRTPLNARVVGSERRDGYRIEKVIFESQPSHFVTAILYLPDATPPFPGVLVPCGHSSNGKARDLYQRAPILLAKNGLAALCYDPIDQGERHQLLDESGKPVYTQSTLGHNLAGIGAVLLGRNTATYRIWDGMRAIDYLQSRTEIDPNRIGCTGISGGGTLTSYLMALDDRVAAAAPGCYLTSFRRLLETIGPQDAEQNIFAQLAFGMDHADYLIMRGPKPTLLMAATDDYFDIEGAWNSYRQAKRFYARLGFAERVDLLETPGRHGFPPAMRVAATRWMRRWLLGIDDAISESEFPIATDQQLQCTPRGEVMLLDGARSIFDLNAELERQAATQRRRFWQEVGPTNALDAVRRISGIRRLKELPTMHSRKTESIRRDGYRIDKLVLQPEPGIWLPALAWIPAHPGRESWLYLHDQGMQTDAGPGGKIEALVRQGHIVLAVDLRGVGETRSQGKHSYDRYLQPEWRESSIAYLIGTSYLAMRAEEILQAARFLKTWEDPAEPREVHLMSVGRVGPPALHAAALESHLFASVTLKNCLVSWSDVVNTPQAKNQFVNLVHGALLRYDLPDLLGTLPAKKVTLLEPWNAVEQHNVKLHSLEVQ